MEADWGVKAPEARGGRKDTPGGSPPCHPSTVPFRRAGGRPDFGCCESRRSQPFAPAAPGSGPGPLSSPPLCAAAPPSWRAARVPGQVACLRAPPRGVQDPDTVRVQLVLVQTPPLRAVPGGPRPRVPNFSPPFRAGLWAGVWGLGKEGLLGCATAAEALPLQLEAPSPAVHALPIRQESPSCPCWWPWGGRCSRAGL